jgi:hypothetical protein
MPTKGKLTREAVVKLEEAIAKLEVARRKLQDARNPRHVDLVVKIEDLRQIYEVLTDPECTPEIEEAGINVTD